jgi:hypothetical protein
MQDTRVVYEQRHLFSRSKVYVVFIDRITLSTVLALILDYEVASMLMDSTKQLQLITT